MVLLLGAVLSTAAGISNGLGRTPPMGWRSWNCYHKEISQAKMTFAANAMVNKSRGVSLLDVGYENCGLDDYYQACGTGAGGSFHNASGYPLIDKTKFPDMRAMTDHAHSIGLKMGWYGNNCGCSEHQKVASWGEAVTKGHLVFGGGPYTDGVNHYIGEVQATIDFGFDGIKLDGCGEFLNLTEFATLLNATGKQVLVENCHWGKDGPGDWGDGGALNKGGDAVDEEHWCPFNFFRTSGDIGSSFGSVMRNLASVIKHQPWNGSTSEVRTGPGCWAYPDMLEVGNLASFEEDRTHFGAWCIVSAPLILGHDLANDMTNDQIWPIVTNRDAISVSQSFAEGAAMHPGGLVATAACDAPGPAPSNTAYLWGVASSDISTGTEWSIGAVGVAAPLKELRTGLCVDAEANGAAKQGAEFGLLPCTGGDSQSFVLEANGNLRAAKTASKLCLAIEDFEGPFFISFVCFIILLFTHLFFCLTSKAPASSRTAATRGRTKSSHSTPRRSRSAASATPPTRRAASTRARRRRAAAAAASRFGQSRSPTVQRPCSLSTANQRRARVSTSTSALSSSRRRRRRPRRSRTSGPGRRRLSRRARRRTRPTLSRRTTLDSTSSLRPHRSRNS